ncbi:MAG: hypoxanthine-guanine phosphoribosyltransferase [Aquisalimonadaceae bacterium]
MNSDEIRAVLMSADLIHDEAEVEAAIGRLADEITRDFEQRMPLLLCVMVGGLVAAGRLLPRLGFPLEVDYLHATRYRGETSGGELVWLARPRTSLAGRSVLIIDDILDEGHTLQGILDDCLARGAREVKTAVLVRKRHDRCVPGIQAEYVGLEVDDRYVFGAGMDYKGFLRNAPGIYAAREQE